MTRVAGSGHPGGSLSSLEMYLVVFSCAELAGEPRDRIVVSHGHTSPGVYASLARLGHLPVDEVVAFFRKARSPYEGHVVRGIPFIDWSTGNLGQGLSAACGLALAGRVRHEDVPRLRAHERRRAGKGAGGGSEPVRAQIRPVQYHRRHRLERHPDKRHDRHGHARQHRGRTTSPTGGT